MKAMASRIFRLCLVLSFSILTVAASADTAMFDLAGPRLEVRVTRAGKTLPISAVPNLQEGDRLWLHPVLPPGQSVEYLMVTAFLQGSTNPPPENWFIKTETWKKEVQDEGVYITVPKHAEQVIVLFAPVTGGDFGTLRNAVRGKPGAFVRASQDLNQANLDRARLDTYVNAIKSVNRTAPDDLKDTSTMLARSLGIKLDPNCFDRITEEQGDCLTANQNSLVLNDGHSSMVAALTNGPASDLAMQASITPQANYGYYSAYVGTVVDVARLMDHLHTAAYEYIPALAIEHPDPRASTRMEDTAPKDVDAMDLKLNTPPSFHNPKSVLVVALPAIEPAQTPPLRPVDPKQVYCLEKDKLLLSVEGAPLVFSSGYAHDMVLRLKGKDGQNIDLPATPSAAAGGYLIDTHALLPSGLPGVVTGNLHGYWGFAPYDGPAFQLQNAHPTTWKVAAEGSNALVIGRDDELHLSGDEAACVESVAITTAAGTDEKAQWKIVKSDQIEVQVPLKNAQPGPVTIQVKEAGLVQTGNVVLRSFAEAGHLESLTLHASDPDAVLKGTRLDEVASVELKGAKLNPGKLTRQDGRDELRLTAASGSAPQFDAGATAIAHVLLKDGRTLDLPATIEAPRPRVALIRKSVQQTASETPSDIRLGSPDELPADSKLAFSLRAETPPVFSRDEQIEVATEDGTFSVMLGLADGTLTLQDAKIALATIDPAKSFGASAFGQLRLRPVELSNNKGDWQPLASLVRLPTITNLHCPPARDAQCTLTGTNLFLIDSISSDPTFSSMVPVPDGFADSTLEVPHPTGTVLYLKLRDNPSAVNTLMLTPQIYPQPKLRESASRKKAAPVTTDTDSAPPATPVSTPGAPPATAPAATPATPSTTPAAAPAAQQPPSSTASSSPSSSPSTTKKANPPAAQPRSGSPPPQ